MSETSKRVEFAGDAGNALVGQLELPRAGLRAFAILAHCFTCSKDLKAERRISRALAERGIAVLRFDFTGLGESGGDFAASNFTSNLEDLLAAAAFLEKHYRSPELLVGHSLGGAAVLAVAKRIPSVRAVATIGAPSDMDHLHAMLERRVPELASEGEAEIDLGGGPLRLHKQLLDDLCQHRLEPAISSIGLPLMIFHSPIDRVVGIDHARRIFEWAKHPKSFVALDGADHLLLTRAEDSVFLAEVLSSWAARYLSAGPTAAPLPAVERGEVEVAGGERGLTEEAWTRSHHFYSDEPTEDGGDDLGPSPYDLLLAALGSCTAMTLRLYADRKGWPLEAIRVRLSHARIHARDCKECESEEGQISKIERKISVVGDLSGGQKEHLLEIANRCPVHRTLTHEIHIESSLVE